MFKEFSLNKIYLFDVDGSYKFINNEFPILNKGKDLIEIMIKDELRCFSKTWLGLISHYEVDLHLDQLINIDFVENKSKVIGLKCGYLMYFKKQIKLDEKFYLIPGFTRFAITEDGVVKSIKYGKILKQNIGPYGYPYVNLYDADKNKWRSISLHILLARTFIINSDYSTKFFVNHIDGNKLNYKLKNLEWVTSIENQKHAVENGLRTDNRKCKVFDVITKEVKNYPSVGSALLALNFKSISANISCKVNGKIIPALLKGRYEIKLDTDESKWFYNNEASLTVKFKSVGPFEAKNISSGFVIKTNTIKELSDLINVSRSTIENVLRHLETKTVSGYLIRSETTNDWSSEYTELEYTKPRKIKVTNIDTGEEVILSSIRQGCKFIGIDKRTLKNRLKTNGSFKNYLIEEIY